MQTFNYLAARFVNETVGYEEVATPVSTASECEALWQDELSRGDENDDCERFMAYSYEGVLLSVLREASAHSPGLQMIATVDGWVLIHQPPSGDAYVVGWVIDGRNPQIPYSDMRSIGHIHIAQ